MAADTGDDGRERNLNTVFIDTSIDTHIATIVSDTDTVSDLKKKIMVEHQQCFPAIGEIKVDCLKVKRRGNLYHLSDSMLVKSAFGEYKKNWFVLVDASRLEQNGETQENAGDKLALPWVAIDGPSKLSLDLGSPLIQPKIVPFVNDKVPSIDQSTSGDSSKHFSQNIEENKRFNEAKKLDPLQEKCGGVNGDTKSKKRIREDALESGPSSKKKHKSEVLGGTINHENSVENSPKSQNLTLDDEHIKTMLVKDNSAHDQLTTIVPAIGGELEEEILGRKNTEAMPDVAMVLEKSIQQETPFETSENEKCNELVEKTVLENEIPSSSMRTSDHEREAPEVAALDHEKVAKHSNKQNAATKEVSSSSTLSKKLQNINNGALDSSQQDVGSTGEKFSGDKLHKRKKTKKSAAKNKDESLVKHADNVVGDIPSTLPALAEGNLNDEQKNGEDILPNFEKKEILDKTSIDALENEVETLKLTETNVSQINAEGIKDKSIKENEKNVKTKKKKKIKKSANGDGKLVENVKKDKINEIETKDTSKEKLADASQVEGGKVEGKESEFETNASQGDVDGKSRKSTSESLPVVPIEENTNGVDNLQLNKLEKTQDAQSGDQDKVKKAKKTHKSSLKGRQDSQRKHQITEEPSNNAASSEVPMNNIENKNDGNNKVDILKDGSQDIDFRQYFGPGQQPNEVAPVDNVKNASKKPKKKTKELPLTPELSTDVAKDQNLPNIDQLKTPKKTKKIDAPKTTNSAPAKRKKEASAESSSSSETSKRSIPNQVKKKQHENVRQSQTNVSDRVTRSKKSAEVAKSSPVQKNLLNTPKKIFEDGSDESSADDNGTENSDTSTRTPSDKSSSSGESDSSFDLRRKGSSARKGKEGGAKNSMNSQLKNVSMADLLRSSSRFKKAKLNASQQMEDTESQPVDFVPESQPMGKI